MEAESAALVLLKSLSGRLVFSLAYSFFEKAFQIIRNAAGSVDGGDHQFIHIHAAEVNIIPRMADKLRQEYSLRPAVPLTKGVQKVGIAIELGNTTAPVFRKCSLRSKPVMWARLSPKIVVR